MALFTGGIASAAITQNTCPFQAKEVRIRRKLKKGNDQIRPFNRLRIFDLKGEIL